MLTYGKIVSHIIYQSECDYGCLGKVGLKFENCSMAITKIEKDRKWR